MDITKGKIILNYKTAIKEYSLPNLGLLRSYTTPDAKYLDTIKYSKMLPGKFIYAMQGNKRIQFIAGTTFFSVVTVESSTNLNTMDVSPNNQSTIHMDSKNHQIEIASQDDIKIFKNWNFHKLTTSTKYSPDGRLFFFDFNY